MTEIAEPTNSFAIFDAMGRQYKVHVGDKIKLDRMAKIKKDKAPLPPGTKVTFNRILFLGTHDASYYKIGNPLVEGAKIVGKVMETGQDKKVIAFKQKRRKGYHRKIGFRRSFTAVEIESIES